MKKLWEINILRAILVFICTTVLVYESSRFYLLNGGMLWIAIFTFGVYFLFFVAPYIGIFIVSKQIYPKKTLVCMIILVVLHTFMVASYTDPYIYLDEGGVNQESANQFLRFLAIFSGILLVVIYGLKLSEGRRDDVGR